MGNSISSAAKPVMSSATIAPAASNGRSPGRSPRNLAAAVPRKQETAVLPATRAARITSAAMTAAVDGSKGISRENCLETQSPASARSKSAAVSLAARSRGFAASSLRRATMVSAITNRAVSASVRLVNQKWCVEASSPAKHKPSTAPTPTAAISPPRRYFQAFAIASRPALV